MTSPTFRVQCQAILVILKIILKKFEVQMGPDIHLKPVLRFEKVLTHRVTRSAMKRRLRTGGEL